MTSALHEIRVVDLSRILAGPWATQLLGDYGADVVKVEKPGSGDDTRQWGPPWLGGAQPGESAYFLSTNRNKRSITVDLAKPEGQRLVRELIASADVVVENFRAGTMQRYGLNSETLRRDNPWLVHCTISAYHSESSRAQEPGYDAMIQAAAGLMSITGPPADEGGGPQKVGVAVADIMTGMYAASAVLAALAARESTGRGQHIEVPLFDAQVAWLANQNMNYLIGGVTPGRRGTAHPNIVPYQAFHTRDGHLMLAVGNDRQFNTCARSIGRDDLAEDPRYADNAGRIHHRDELVPSLQATFAEETTAHWLERLQADGVPCGPVNDLHEVFSGEYATEREIVRYMDHPQMDSLPGVANPVTFSESEVSYRRAPPLLGQHSDEILGEWLDIDSEEIGRLRADGVI